MTPRTIAIPLPCIACGYDLLGLAEGAVCPECAIPVRESTDHSLTPARRRFLRRAATIIACAIVVRPALLIGPPMLLAKYQTAGAPYPLTTPLSTIITLCIVGLLANIADWTAWFQFTSARGLSAIEQPGRRIITTLRIAVIAQPALLVAFAISATLDGYDSTLAIVLLAIVARTTQLVAGLLLVRRVARRLDARFLAHWSAAMTTAIPIAVIVAYWHMPVALVAVALHLTTMLMLRAQLGPSPATAPSAPTPPIAP